MRTSITTWPGDFLSAFASGFPHGEDPFISITATAWGVTALAPACQ